VFHAICTQGNRVDSWLLVVGSQIANLTPDLSFGHNLCFRCPNGSCEPILDIYISIVFQWYKKLFELMGFDPYNRLLKIQESIGTRTPKMEVHLRVWGFIPSHSFALLGARNVTPGLPSWPTIVQTFALVTSPKLRLQQMPWVPTVTNPPILNNKIPMPPTITFHIPRTPHTNHRQ